MPDSDKATNTDEIVRYRQVVVHQNIANRLLATRQTIKQSKQEGIG